MAKRLIQFNNWFNTKFGWFFLNGRKESTHTEQLLSESEYIVRDMKNVSDMLDHADQLSLQVVVVTWALKHMKENPKLTITEAMTMGYKEWIK